MQQCVYNNLIFKCVLADSWFSSAENFRFVADLNCHFIRPLNANRKVALSQSDHQQGRYQPIESLSLEEGQTLVVWVETVDFPLVLTRQVFKDGDRVQGHLYVVTNDLTADSVCIQTHYARRWRIEEFHKSLKSNAGYAHSPAHRVRSQSNNVFLTMLAFVNRAAGAVGSLAALNLKKSFCLKNLTLTQRHETGPKEPQHPQKSIYSIS